MTERLEIKAALTVDDAGTITGIAWPFGSPDRVGDVIEKGAFTSPEILPMLFAHDQGQVIGVWDEISETPDGLTVSPFFEFFEDHGEESTFTACMDTAGIEPPVFTDDSGPKSATGEIEKIFDEDPEPSVYHGRTNSLARAEIMVGQLIDAAAALARIVNDYKRHEIDARISEIEQSDLSGPDAKKKAFADMAELKKMRDQLDKQVRWTFPQWKVMGE